MKGENDLLNIIDGMGQPLNQAQGAVNVLFHLCEAESVVGEKEFAFIAGGLEKLIEDLRSRYEAAHAQLSQKRTENLPGPRAVG